jgi:hypothetical protein
MSTSSSQPNCDATAIPLPPEVQSSSVPDPSANPALAAYGSAYDPTAAAAQSYQAYSAYAMQYMNSYPQSYPYSTPYAPYAYAYAQPSTANSSTAAAPAATQDNSTNQTSGRDHKASSSDDADDDDDDPTIDRGQSSVKANNVLPFWGNEKTMNLNSLLLTNILQSPYFKVKLFQLKTYHEVIDEIYYHVKHLEPWERGSRKVSFDSCVHVLFDFCNNYFYFIFRFHNESTTDKRTNRNVRLGARSRSRWNRVDAILHSVQTVHTTIDSQAADRTAQTRRLAVHSSVGLHVRALHSTAEFVLAMVRSVSGRPGTGTGQDGSDDHDRRARPTNADQTRLVLDAFPANAGSGPERHRKEAEEPRSRQRSFEQADQLDQH